MRAISRDTTVLAYRKRFLPTINTETGAHRSNWFRAAILCAIDRSRRVPQRATGNARGSFQNYKNIDSIWNGREIFFGLTGLLLMKQTGSSSL